MNLGQWLDLRDLGPFPPDEFEARFKSVTDLSTLLSLHDRCANGECSENCSGQLPYPSLERDGTIIDRWNYCQPKRMARLVTKVTKLLSVSGLPLAYRSKTLEQFVPADGTRDAYEAIRNRIESDNPRGLVLCGPPGTGKTHLAAALVNDRVRQAQPTIFAVVARLLDDLRAAETSNRGPEVRKLLEQTPLLVLDDLGKERSTPYAGEQLFRLIDTRLANDRQTVVTTNMGDLTALRSALGEQHGAAIVSRLVEHCEWVRMDGRDWRMNPQPRLLNG